MSMGRRRTDSVTIRLISPILIMFCAYFIWEGHSPVISNFEITHTVQTDDTVALYGKFHKIRNCKFDSLFVTTPMELVTDSRKLIFEFTDVANTPIENRSTRQKGSQHFGPWTVNIDPQVKTLTLRALHQCNFGLYVSTRLVEDFEINVD